MSYEVAGVSHRENYAWNSTGFATDPAIRLISLGGQAGRWQPGRTLELLGMGLRHDADTETPERLICLLSIGSSRDE